MISGWTVILGLFFYFLFMWLFRFVFIMLLIKVVSGLKEKGKEAMKNFNEGMNKGNESI